MRNYLQEKKTLKVRGEIESGTGFKPVYFSAFVIKNAPVCTIFYNYITEKLYANNVIKNKAYLITLASGWLILFIRDPVQQKGQGPGLF